MQGHKYSGLSSYILSGSANEGVRGYDLPTIAKRETPTAYSLARVSRVVFFSLAPELQGYGLDRL